MTKTTLERLTALGEEVLGKASQNPTAHRLLQSAMQNAMQLRNNVDDLSKRVRGLEAMEKKLGSAREARCQARGQHEARDDVESEEERYEEEVGTRTRKAPGTTSNAAGVVPTCSPSTSIGRCSAASTSTRALRSTSTFGWVTCLPL